MNNGPIKIKPLVSCLVIDIEADIETERMAYVLPERGERGVRTTLTDVGIFALLLALWVLSESVLAADIDDSQLKEQFKATPSYSSLWLRSYDTAEGDPKLGDVDDDFREEEKAGSGQDEASSFTATTLASDVLISVSGPILRARVRQTFSNPSQVWAEGVYSFPLPEQAAVDQLRMIVGERVIEGQVHEKEKAKRTYTKARASGKRASLLSRRQANVFTTSVANIGPGEEVVVEFEYQQLIDFRDHGYSFRFPMASTPKYVPPTALDDPEFIPPMNVIREQNEAPGNPVAIQVDIKAGFPIEMPLSQSHTVSTEKLSEEHYRINLAGSAELSNRDFRLSWQLTPSQEPMVTVLREDVGDQSYGLLMVMPPQASTHISMERELVLVLDVSGSMQGESIVQARKAILKAIHQLKPEDRFNVVWFNTHASKLFSQSRTATPGNVRLARDRVKQLSANGGTNMLSAVRIALDAPTDAERLRQVVFITDGAVGNETKLFSAIRNSLGSSRLFTVGIGSAPNGYFMRKAAKAGRGTFTYVGQTSEVDEKINYLLRQLEAPALTDLDFDLNGQHADVLPSPLPDLYLGEPVYVAFRTALFPEFASLKGNLGGVSSWLKVPLNSHLRHKGIAIEWARRQIDGLMQQHRESAKPRKSLLRKEITELAIVHHQVSKFTSMVAVDVTPARAGGLLNTDRITANRPKGMDAKTPRLGQGIRLAQTATDARFRLLFGLVLLVLSVLLWWVLGLVGGRASWSPVG